MKESIFQSKLIKDLKVRYPGCTVLKNDSGYCSGIPDLLILKGRRWAMLECKKSRTASHQPNQDYFINKFNDENPGGAFFIFPENREEVLMELDKLFENVV